GLKAGFPDVQGRMAQERIKEAEETGAQELVSCCPFCYQGLQVGIGVLNSNIIMKDMSQYIAESILGYDVFERAAKEAEEKKRKKEEARAKKKLEQEKKKAEKEEAAKKLEQEKKEDIKEKKQEEIKEGKEQSSKEESTDKKE
ncbi:MAG: hypothetical protein GY857_01780, partial [Desulfobacula sp.]|nr:hypothetical protein [Desulfobacula sp.]